MQLSFPADARHAAALRDVIVQAARQAGGSEERARDVAEQAVSLLRQSSDGHGGSDTLGIVLRLGPPIEVVVGGRTLTLDVS